jgi:hypothetical protein
MSPAPKLDSSLVISYLTLRKAVGVLGILLPFLVSLGALLIFHTRLQDSISAYYYTGTRNVFVGTLWAIGFFLFAYRGYERRDEIAGKLAWIFAVGTSLFPTAPECESCTYSRIVSDLHWTFAALLFLTLSYFSLFLFTLTDPLRTPTRRKLQRNKVYKACGYTMLACILLVPVVKLIPAVAAAAGDYDPVFWLEAITIVAFGISWLTKGEAILGDQGRSPQF